MVVLSLIILVLLALTGLEIWRIRAANLETSNYFDVLGQSAQAEIQAKATRSFQNTQKSEIEAVNAVVLSDEKIASVIEDVEEVSRALGVETEISSVTSPTINDNKNPQRYSMVVTSTGTWSGCFSLLRAFENLPYGLSLDTTRLVKDDAGGGWRLETTLSLYSFD